MSTDEKVTWLSVLVVIWGVLLFAYVLVTIVPGPKANEGLGVLAWMTGAFTLTYLLILSWRAAYLSGRKS